MVPPLSEKEFKETMTTKMMDVTETAIPVIDIWPYVSELVTNKIADKYVYENNLVELVYRNELNTFDHVLIPTPTRNVFIVIVVDLKNIVIKGHYQLDLNKEYGS